MGPSQKYKKLLKINLYTEISFFIKVCIDGSIVIQPYTVAFKHYISEINMLIIIFCFNKKFRFTFK